MLYHLTEQAVFENYFKNIKKEEENEKDNFSYYRNRYAARQL